MTGFRKEGRLSEEEAARDIEALNRGAESTGLPNIHELKNIEDVRALEKLLKEAGVYAPPEVSDEISLGASRIAEVRHYAREKDPKEIHYEERAVQLVRDIMKKRFNIEVPDCPVERILIVPDWKMEELNRSLFDTEYVEGIYENGDCVIFIKDKSEHSLAKRTHVVVHELIHFALHSAPDYMHINLKNIQKNLVEGLTEQIALEISADLISDPDFFEEMKKWHKLDPNTSKEDFLRILPTLSQFRTEDPRGIALSTHYSYLRERYLLDYLAATLKEDAAENPELNFPEDDPLKVFVDCITGKDISNFTDLVRASFGKAGSKLLFLKTMSGLDLAIELDKIRRARKERKSSQSPDLPAESSL